jgi:DNA-directed RNA polymerase specialized sigma24 family protein
MGNNIDVNKILEQLDPYIRRLARGSVPRHIAPAETRDLEADDLAQNALIKLWMALQKDVIGNPRAYARRIVHTESVNMVRRYKGTCPLPTNDDGELYLGKVMLMPEEDMQDPANQLEQEDALADCVRHFSQAIQGLPSRQRQAMLSSLNDQVDDALPLINTFKEQKIDIEAGHWPEDKDDKQRLKASLSIGRKKLRYFLTMTM